MTGQQMVDQVCSMIGMPESPLFALQYTDAKGFDAFIRPEKKVLSQDLNKKEDPKMVTFKVKYFPESVSDEVVDPTVQRLFWKQIKAGIVSDEIYCPPELCILFAAQGQQFDKLYTSMRKNIHMRIFGDGLASSVAALIERKIGGR